MQSSFRAPVGSRIARLEKQPENHRESRRAAVQAAGSFLPGWERPQRRWCGNVSSAPVKTCECPPEQKIKSVRSNPEQTGVFRAACLWNCPSHRLRENRKRCRGGAKLPEGGAGFVQCRATGSLLCGSRRRHQVATHRAELGGQLVRSDAVL